MEPLYNPPSPESSRVFQFLKRVNTRHHLALSSYYDLYKWSTSNIDQFWSAVWDDTEVCGSKGAHVVDVSSLPPSNPPWFSDAKVNYAENMLRCRSSEKTALIEASMFSVICFVMVRVYECITAEPEPNNIAPPLRHVTYLELYSLVSDLVSALLLCGLKAGDRVASYSSNCIVGQHAFTLISIISRNWIAIPIQTPMRLISLVLLSA